MAWRSSGTTNSEMVDNLTRNGIINSEEVERGFRNVDRKFFVPKDNEDVAHADQPLKEGNVHISAPHIYGSVLEALELKSNSALSFLNIGSGTGYLSCIVADILGPTSLNVGIEIHEDVVQHCHESIGKWRRARAHRIRSRQQSDSSHPTSEGFTNGSTEKRQDSAKGSGTSTSTAPRSEGLPHIEIIHGNGLNVVANSGESLVGFDRIYVGAAVEKSKLKNITKLLCPGGVLVGPVDDELVKVVRIAQAKDSVSGGQRVERRQRSGVALGSGDRDSTENEDDPEDGDDDDVPRPRSSNDREFTQQALSGVRFAPLLPQPNVRTIIPSRQWVPGMHQHFPNSFQNATIELLLCSNAEFSQPLPKPVKPENCINYAAMLPKAIWIEILSFTHRKWFEPPETDAEFLRRRLLEEQANAAKAQQARMEAEARCHVAERERDLYRLLARRWQSRLQQQQRAANAASSSSRDVSNDDTGDDTDAAVYPGARRVMEVAPALDALISGEERAAIIGFGAMLRQFHAANNRDQNAERTGEAGNERGELFVQEQDSAMDELADEMEEEEDDDDEEDEEADGEGRILDEDDDEDGDEEEDDDDDRVEDDLFDFGQAMDEEDAGGENAVSVDSHTGVNELPLVGSSQVAGSESGEVAVGSRRSTDQKSLLGKDSPLRRVEGTTLSLTSEDL